MKKLRGGKPARSRGEPGFTLIEVVVALALVSTAGIAFLSSLSTASRSTMSVDDKTMANSLASSQLEYVLSQPYDAGDNPPVYELIPGIPEGWTIVSAAARLDPEADGLADDDGLQLVTVEVYHGDTLELSLTTRKVDKDHVP